MTRTIQEGKTMTDEEDDEGGFKIIKKKSSKMSKLLKSASRTKT